MRLISKITGATRYGPWISLMSSDGVVYFGNLVTRETRWLPPHRWFEGWITRASPDAPCGVCWSGSQTAFTLGTRVRDPMCSEGMLALDSLPISSFLSGRRLDDRELLPWQLARLRVDGGAPYMLEYVCTCWGDGRYRDGRVAGSPRYDPDHFDTPSSYPPDTERYSWSSKRGCVKMK